MLKYKIDVIETLKESGYNSTRILRENILSQSAMQKLRKGEMVGIKTLDQICKLLDIQYDKEYFETHCSGRLVTRCCCRLGFTVYVKLSKERRI